MFSDWPFQEVLSGTKGGAGPLAPEEWSLYTLRYMVVHACLGSSLGLLEDSLRDFDFWSGVFQSGARSRRGQKRCEWHAYCWLYVQFSFNDIDTGYPSLCATSLPFSPQVWAPAYSTTLPSLRRPLGSWPLTWCGGAAPASTTAFDSPGGEQGRKGKERKGVYVLSSEIQRTPHPTFHRKSSSSEPPP